MLSLPDYPWDAMAPYRELADQHPQGAVNLSIGTPVDPTAPVVREALAAAADAPGYPTTHGSAALRTAIADWFARRRGVPNLDPENALPTIGSKELVAWLPTLLGLGAGDVVVRPTVAYPTYDMGAMIAGADALAVDDVLQCDEQTLSKVRLIWLNSPANPTGRVDSAEWMRQVVQLARRIGAVVASDECYAELPWEVDEVPSILDPRVAGDSHENLLALYSVSKQSNLAGYRAAFAAGCPQLIAGLLKIRRHAGMIMPAPVQEALRVALGDDEHVASQREVYRRRRQILKPALEASGLTGEDSAAGLYLWCRADTTAQSADSAIDTWTLVQRMAERGVIVGPGTFYGTAGEGFVRVALTAPDERIRSAAQRLRS